MNTWKIRVISLDRYNEITVILFFILLRLSGVVKILVPRTFLQFCGLISGSDLDFWTPPCDIRELTSSQWENIPEYQRQVPAGLLQSAAGLCRSPSGLFRLQTPQIWSDKMIEILMHSQSCVCSGSMLHDTNISLKFYRSYYLEALFDLSAEKLDFHLSDWMWCEDPKSVFM